MVKSNETLFLDLDINNDRFAFASSITSAMSDAEAELQDLNTNLSETLETIKQLTPECDNVDYALSASSGALCGIIDIFLVGKPGESPLGNITDRWFENRTKDFAKLCCPNKDNSTLSSAIKNLEKNSKFHTINAEPVMPQVKYSILVRKIIILSHLRIIQVYVGCFSLFWINLQTPLISYRMES